MLVPAAPGSSAAQAMDDIYRYQRHIYDVTRSAYLLGRDRLIAGLEVPDGGCVLEIGCGTGRNLVRAARRYRSARLYGLDVSGAMLASARISIERSGLSGRIDCAQADATGFDAESLVGRAQFDRVFISYALSMIPDWELVLDNARRAVAADGVLAIIDFGDLARYPWLLRRAQFVWLSRFSVVPIADFEKRLETWAAHSAMRPMTEHLYGGYAISARLTHC